MINNYYELWNPSGAHIQIVLGENVLNSYSNHDFFGRSKDDAYILLTQISNIRDMLNANGIILPRITISDSLDIAEDEFIIFFGTNIWGDNYLKSNIDDILIQLSASYSAQDCTYMCTVNCYQSGMKALQSNDFQNAIKYFQDAYYRSSFSSEALIVEVQSLLGICVIQLINHRYCEAERFSLRACLIADDPAIVDPFLKYQANVIAGTALSELGNGDKAYTHFEKALYYISNLHAPVLTEQALSAMIQIRLSQENYLESAELIELLIQSLLNNPDQDIDHDTMFKLAYMKSQLYEFLYKQIEMQYRELKQEYDNISGSFLYVFRDFIENHEKVIQFLGQVAVTLVLSWVGNPRNTTINQYSRNGTNIVAKSISIRGERYV